MRDASGSDPTAYGPRRHLARLFGVRLVSDVHERLCDLGLRPPLDDKRRGRLASIRAAGALFIHIPKNAGMSVSKALYKRQIKHASIRYYAKVAPGLVAALPSFAVMRDPVDRFLSAYCYGRAGGSHDNLVSLPFRSTYMGFGSVDEALDHLEGVKGPYDLDHIFRPQSWYVTGRDGALGVGRLMLLEEIDHLAEVAPQLRATAIPHLNRSRLQRPSLTPRQLGRLRRFYSADFALIDPLRAGLQARILDRLGPPAQRLA